MDYPGNQAVAYGEKTIYVLIDIEFSNLDKLENKKLIIAKSLLKEVTSFCNIKKFKIIKEFKRDHFCKEPLFSSSIQKRI